MQIVIFNVTIMALLTLGPAPVNVQEAIQENIAKVRVLIITKTSVCSYKTHTHTLYTVQTTHCTPYRPHTHTVHRTDHTLYTIQTTHTHCTPYRPHTVHHTDHTYTVHHTLQFCLFTAVCSIADECRNNSTAIEEDCRCECTKDYTGEFCEGEN